MESAKQAPAAAFIFIRFGRHHLFFHSAVTALALYHSSRYCYVFIYCPAIAPSVFPAIEKVRLWQNHFSGPDLDLCYQHPPPAVMIRMLLAICLFFSLSTEAQTLVESKILFGRTIGRQPYLDYGLGSDRLGGSSLISR